MALKDYIVQEVALDCEAGLLSRREALRRLGLLGVTAAAATALLAACGDDGDASSSTSAAATSAGATPSSAAAAESSTHAGLLGRGSASDGRGGGDPLQRSER